ncbi:MAG TPA: hypothetical protein VFV88_11560 [Steroidobacteraceae bacterium]|jgi:hypothetical protein|nr:hypothetical protein [Steroidobacteraceae bacterium]
MSSAWRALAVGAVCLSGSALAGNFQPVTVEIVAPDGRTFREFPVDSRDGALRSYLEAEKGARYQVRVRNRSGERLGLVIAVDGRNIINGKRSELARSEPMYVIDAWDTQSYAGWRASLETINEFYFTDWKHSYAEAFGDRSARGVIAVAVYREVQLPPPAWRPFSEDESGRAEAPAASAEAGAADRAKVGRRDQSPGTGYGDRRADPAVRVQFEAQSNPDSRHFIKYEWRETLCRKQLLECGEKNRFWDESVLGFAPPPPGRR